MKKEQAWIEFVALVDADNHVAFTVDTKFLDGGFRIRNVDGSRSTDILSRRSVTADPLASFNQLKTLVV